MPALRSTAPRLAVVAAFVCTSLVGPLPFKIFGTRACPVYDPPKPLRTLYTKSERVVVAYAGEPHAFDESSYFPRRTFFEVSETLKGDPGERRVEVGHLVATDPEFPGNFQAGDRVLLFLKYDTHTGVYHSVDLRYGAKKLSDDDLKIYLKRIGELSYITSLTPAEQPRELAEWLVRCAEEPATRWEGAYELMVSLAHAERNASVTEETDDPAEVDEASGEAAEVAGPFTIPTEVAPSRAMRVPGVTGIYGTDVDSSVAAALTGEQKKRLADALFSAERVGQGEAVLVHIVKRWDDERMVPFLMRYLRGVEENPPYEAAGMLEVLAYALKDPQLVRLAEDYNQHAAYYDDEDETETSDEASDGEGEVADDAEAAEDMEVAEDTGDVEETAESEEAAGSEESAEAEAASEAEDVAETEDVAESEDVAVEEEGAETQSLLSDGLAPDGTKLKATQMRSEMLRNFLAAVDGRLSEAALRHTPH